LRRGKGSLEDWGKAKRYTTAKGTTGAKSNDREKKGKGLQFWGAVKKQRIGKTLKSRAGAWFVREIKH